MVLVLEIWQTQCSRMKDGVFLRPARVLLQERETTAEGVRIKGVVWITEGTCLIRCVVQLLRFLSESEKELYQFFFILNFTFYELRRKRNGSVSTMTPHQCWNVCDWKTTERDQPSEAQLSLPTCTHRKSEKHPSDCGHHASEKWRCLLPTFRTYTKQGGTQTT